jgi:hypothetical protein
MSAVDYVTARQSQYRAAAAAAEAQRLLAERQAADEAVGEQHQMVEAAFERFAKGAPRLPKVAGRMEELLAGIQSTDGPPATPEEATARLGVSYETAQRLEAAMKRAQDRFELQELERGYEEAQGSFYGTTGMKYRSLEEFQQDEIGRVRDDRNPGMYRPDGSSRLAPQTAAASLAETHAEWDEQERTLAGFDGIDAAPSSFHAEGSFERQREQALQDGWSV